jgi:transposase
MANDAVTAVDIAKNVFEVAVSIQPGRVKGGQRLPRRRFLEYFANCPRTTVVMEACGTAHHWARELQKLGHRVVLLPARLVAPYRKGNKTDRADAKALLEAYRNEDIHPVPIKSVHQHGLMSLHRVRSKWVQQRTATINTVRGLLRELGHFIPVGSKNVVPETHAYIGDPDSNCPHPLRELLVKMCEEIGMYERSIRSCELELERLAKEIPMVAQLRSIPGIGLLTATALVGSVGEAHRFKTARHFASYLGLTPKENSSGGKRRLGRISKRGNPYLRHLLIHGARSLMRAAATKSDPDRLRSWALAKAASRGPHKSAAAVANKLARIAWAVWTRNSEYRPQPLAAA